MNKARTMVVAAVFVFSAGFVMAAEARGAGWQPIAEASVGVHDKYLNRTSGLLTYDKSVSTQSVLVAMDKGGRGFYVQTENFSPLEKAGVKETDFYLGFYTEAAGMKFNTGYAYYWVRETGALDCHIVYTIVDFPEVGWRIVPFAKAAYAFAKKYTFQDEAGNTRKTSIDGFMYYGGLRREFQIHERVSTTAEVSVGGNTGIYGMPAENLSFAREKLEISVSLAERWKLKIAGLTQQNLGRRNGVAADTDRLFVSAAVVWIPIPF